jgi:predicted negative regulator of RcsB-dependent stress response
LASYHSDEEQVEALTRWWRENGRSVLAGVIIGVGALLGWRGWVTYQDNQAAAASLHYAELREAVARADVQALEQSARTLEDSFASTPYAALAALALAKVKAEAGDLKAAAAQLRWAMENSPQAVVRDLASLRLARVLNAQGKYAETLELLARGFPASYTSLVEEIRGDALAAQGKIDAARQAYDRALLTASGDVKYLRMKRADLGENEAPQS